VPPGRARNASSYAPGPKQEAAAVGVGGTEGTSGAGFGGDLGIPFVLGGIVKGGQAGDFGQAVRGEGEAGLLAAAQVIEEANVPFGLRPSGRDIGQQAGLQVGDGFRAFTIQANGIHGRRF
jgi:hypothetical protein